ncbi:MAG TPA: hypothetical protein VF517_04580 [Thermoleophilaceae bacterium]
MGSRPTKPTFQGVVDLGLRDVGVRNEPRRLAIDFGKGSLQAFALVFLSSVAMCAIVAGTGAGGWIAIPFALTFTGAVLALGLRSARRSPMMVVRVTAEGTNQAAWMMMVPLVLLALLALISGSPLMVPLLVLPAAMAALVLRTRGYVPRALRRLRPLLGADEPVLGDGVGRADGVRGWHNAFRLVVATDRRLLVATSTRSTERFPLLDVPYDRVSRFGIEWRQLGRVGVLSLTVTGAGGAPSETHVIGSIAPANLLSIAEALQSNGVQADDPATVSSARLAWDEARAAASARRGRAAEPRTPRTRLLDRADVNTAAFDRGLWLLLALTAFAFYVNPFGVGLGAGRDPDLAVLALVPVVCGVSSYVSGTRSALAYAVPLNLLAAPAFFFAPAGYVIALMVVMSAVAAAGLWAGSALRRATGGPVDAGAGKRAVRGSLRYTLGGAGLVRITGVMLAGMLAIVATAGAAGFELTSLRLAIDEATLEQVPVDGRSNLTGDVASVTYTTGPDLHEFITDQPTGGGVTGAARWELRSSFTKGRNVVSLARYTYEPALDDPAAVADFVAEKDREHSRLAGSDVTHSERVVDGRRGYVWNHRSPYGYWYYAAWFPQRVHTVRVECIAKQQEARFKRLCAEAVGSLEFR